jgi:hypothetical protein
MRLKMKYTLAVAAAVLACAAVSVRAQSPIVAIAGSSAQFLELGQSSSLTTASGTICVWDSGSAKSFTLTDERGASGGPYTDSGAAWVEWNSGTGTCAAPAGTWSITFFVNTDSVVGNRCFFAAPACHVATSYTGTTAIAAGGGLTGISEVSLPSTVFAAINNTAGTPPGVPLNAVATDIRPEDAKFAVNRALTPCGVPIQDTAIVNIGGSPTPTAFYTQYLGIGDQTATANVGTKISEGQGSTTKFNVLNFNIQGNDPFTGNAVTAYTVTQLGAVPVLVFVNPGNGGGFGSLQLSNIDRAVLAGYLDGTYGSTSDAFLQQTGSTPPSGSHVFIREYMSGTYNTMEYSIPNSVQIHSSQEVGVNAQIANNNGFPFPPYNCSGATVGGGPTAGLSTLTGATGTVNPLFETIARPSGETSVRGREIGTGDEIKAVITPGGLGTTGNNIPGTDGLGYAFWSAANFNGAKANTGKYLTVDGVDPLEEVWTDGLIPNTVYDNLGSVSLDHIRDGSYPIYSILRLASSSTATPTITALVNSAIKFLSPTQPDFVHTTQLPIVRSHFAPPGVAFGGCTPVVGTSNCATTASNGTSNTEAGGDVGGLALTLQSEFDYIADTGNGNGNTGMRQ